MTQVRKNSTTKHSRWGFTLIELMIVISILGVLVAILIPSFSRARARGVLTACQGNLKNIATALELYAVDNEHRYPPALSALTPRYISIVPRCPSNGLDTYSTGFASNTNPDGYSIICNGLFHEQAGITTTGYPQYFSGSGPRNQ